MAIVKITQGQAPQFRAIIKTLEGRLFDPTEDLATREELDAEGLTEVFPAQYSIYKSNSSIAPYIGNTEEAEAVEGYTNREITRAAFINPSEVEEDELDYNFKFTPANRSTFAFTKVGNYFVDFKIMPKRGAAIVIRVNVQVS